MKSRNFLFGMLLFMATTISSAKPLNLVTLEYPPYEYTQNGEIKGMAVDIVKLIFKEMNQPITIEVLPWARAIRYIKEGKRDAIFTAFKNSKRETFADYSTSVLMPQVVSLFVKKGSSIKYEGEFNEFSQYSIGVVRKVSYGKLLDEALSNNIFKRVDAVNDGTQNFKRLLKGRIDIIASNKYGGMYILKQLGKLDEVTVLPEQLQAVSSYIAFSKKRNLTHIRDKFDVILKRLKKDGTYSKILDSYFNK